MVDLAQVEQGPRAFQTFVPEVVKNQTPSREKIPAIEKVKWTPLNPR